jgi:voltage-gated potassium channel
VRSEVQEKPDTTWRQPLDEVVFEAETPAGRAFDLTLIVLIILSVIVVLIETSRLRTRASFDKHSATSFGWRRFFTILFSLEYILRLVAVKRPIQYATSTLTTVGYGDLSPKTGLGKLPVSAVMIMGYGIIAVPTGIVTGELIRASKSASTHVCPECHEEGHDLDAAHCKYCGSAL